MKQHVELIKDSFIDYAGKEHLFVIAAVSELLDGYSVVHSDGVSVACVNDCAKGIRIGYAICNPTDTFDEKVGALKAVARARKAEVSLYVTDGGLINTTMVQGLLKQEAEWLKEHPEQYIEGYSDSKKRYLKNHKMEEIKEHFTETERIVVENLKKDPRFLDNVNAYLDWLDKQKHGCKKQQG